MKSFLPLLIAIGLLLSAGCASTPTRVDRGPIRAKSFSFLPRGEGPLPTFTDNRQGIHAMFQEAISRNLVARGMTRVDSGGDLLVAYLLIVGNNASTETLNDYFGYREDAAALHEKAHDAYTAKESATYFEAGTLVIDLIDRGSNRLLKRNFTTRRLLRDLPPDVRQARIQEAVDAVLKDLQLVR